MTPQRGTDVEHRAFCVERQTSDLRIREKNQHLLKDYESAALTN